MTTTPIFGENFKSAEQAYQLTKAIRTGNLVAADKIRDAKSALECKLIGNTVTNTPQWRDEADDVMEKILCAKIDQLKEMNDLLASSRPHTIFAHSVYDLYWGTGLDSEKTANTAPDAWPGQNKFGKLLSRLADKRRTKPRSVSMSRAVKTRQQGIDKYTC
uniref:NADAR domain-containing protein n=1 Tax=Magallana gigas TaxID=29159 RepID=A0A8W8J1W9_MAGGI